MKMEAKRDLGDSAFDLMSCFVSNFKAAITDNDFFSEHIYFLLL